MKSTEWGQQAYAQVISEQPNQEILANLEAEAGALLEKSGTPEVRNGCLHVLALVAAARRDDERVNELYTCLFENTHDIQYLLQHTSINVKHGEWLLGQRRIEQLWHMAPDNLRSLNLIFTWSMLIGDYFRGQEIREQLLRLNSPDRANMTATTSAWLELAESGGLDRTEYIKRWEVAINTIYSAGLRPAGTATCRGSDNSLSLRFQCEATVDQLVDIDFAIADAMVTSFNDPLSQYVTFATIDKNGRQTQ
ncbi:hypothetical protein RAS12_11815 [Achromobacter seleniivolatilans]|uniref:Uncharacterized protein n=1 Tax=Achromobacter seleniivolatilans TaxID=3047478 RepID=A0ABY9M9Z7_9BURK|nr:hypothetical protein [Achromobacter sp. R39]WMD23023.1 hypothetical protein RAS12_11815 [Achromobacter sp. R39]